MNNVWYSSWFITTCPKILLHLLRPQSQLAAPLGSNFASEKGCTCCRHNTVRILFRVSLGVLAGSGLFRAVLYQLVCYGRSGFVLCISRFCLRSRPSSISNVSCLPPLPVVRCKCVSALRRFLATFLPGGKFLGILLWRHRCALLLPPILLVRVQGIPAHTLKASAALRLIGGNTTVCSGALLLLIGTPGQSPTS